MELIKSEYFGNEDEAAKKLIHQELIDSISPASLKIEEKF